MGRSQTGRISFNFVSLIKACRAKASPKPCPAIDRCGTLSAVASSLCRHRAWCASPVRSCVGVRRAVAGLPVSLQRFLPSPHHPFDARLRSQPFGAVAIAPVHLAPLDCGSRSLRCASGGRRALFLFFVPQSRPVAPSSVRSAEREAAAPKFLLRRGKAVASLSAALCAFFRGGE